MKKVVSFSGGESSRYTSVAAIKEFGRENVDFVVMDTGAEHPLTYEFIRRVNTDMQLNLVCLRADLSLPLGKGVGFNVIDVNDMKQDLVPFKAMMKKYGVPYIGGMFCTDRMKLKPYKKYCDGKYGKGNYETWLGIRFDEPKRLVGDNKKAILSTYKQLVIDGLDDGEISLLYVNARKNTDELKQWEISDTSKELLKRRLSYLDKENLHYLAEISEFEKVDILDFSKKASVSLNLDEWSGNCTKCPKKSDLKLAASAIDNPLAYVNFVAALKDDSVRVDDKTGSYLDMYRKHNSLESLIARFDGVTGEEIKARIRGSKMIDTNSCSESCEVFQ